MENRYETIADVRLRLENTFVCFKGEYYYAMLKDPEERETNISLCSIINKRELYKVDANSPDLILMSNPLGYTKTSDNCAAFLSRIPYRRQKQGIAPESIAYIDIFTRRQGGCPNEFLFCDNFRQMLRGQYPSFRDALAAVTLCNPLSDQTAQPFSRNFCILNNEKKEILLQYNCTNIGRIGAEGVVTLFPEHNHSVFALRLAELGVSVA